MSNLLVQNIKHTNNTTAQTIDTSGRTTAVLNNDTTYRSDNGAVTQNMVQGLTKAWVHSLPSGGTPVLTDSFNIASITDAATGAAKPNFTNNMNNITFSVAIAAQYTSLSGTGAFFTQDVYTQRATSLFSLQHYENASLTDPYAYNSVIAGDLA